MCELCSFFLLCLRSLMCAIFQRRISLCFKLLPFIHSTPRNYFSLQYSYSMTSWKPRLLNIQYRVNVCGGKLISNCTYYCTWEKFLAELIDTSPMLKGFLKWIHVCLYQLIRENPLKNRLLNIRIWPPDTRAFLNALSTHPLYRYSALSYSTLSIPVQMVPHSGSRDTASHCRRLQPASTRHSKRKGMQWVFAQHQSIWSSSTMLQGKSFPYKTTAP